MGKHNKIIPFFLVFLTLNLVACVPGHKPADEISLEQALGVGNSNLNNGINPPTSGDGDGDGDGDDNNNGDTTLNSASASFSVSGYINDSVTHNSDQGSTIKCSESVSSAVAEVGNILDCHFYSGDNTTTLNDSFSFQIYNFSSATSSYTVDYGVVGGLDLIGGSATYIESNGGFVALTSSSKNSYCMISVTKENGLYSGSFTCQDLWNVVQDQLVTVQGTFTDVGN